MNIGMTLILIKATCGLMQLKVSFVRKAFSGCIHVLLFDTVKLHFLLMIDFYGIFCKARS